MYMYNTLLCYSYIYRYHSEWAVNWLETFVKETKMNDDGIFTTFTTVNTDFLFYGHFPTSFSTSC